MPDTFMKTSSPKKELTTSNALAPASGEVSKFVALPQINDFNVALPAIYYCDNQPSRQDFDDAVELGFTSIGIPYLSHERLKHVFQEGRGKDLDIVMDLDITVLKDENALLDEHPDWFATSPAGPKFVYLSEFDPSVDWWEGTIGRLAEVQAFRCLNLGSVAPAIWTRLIGAAKHRNPKLAFYAWTIGLAPEVIASLAPCGFDFVFSSSCWWDFKSGWLDDEAQRLAAIGPVIALVTPPNVAWRSHPSHRRRALDFAAFYGAGWLMPAGFQRCDELDLSSHIFELNRLRHEKQLMFLDTRARVISSIGSKVAILGRDDQLIFISNSSVESSTRFSTASMAGRLPGRPVDLSGRNVNVNSWNLNPAQSQIFKVLPISRIEIDNSFQPDCQAPRIAIETIAPQVDSGEFPVRRVVGEWVTVEADLVADGHDKLAADLVWRCIDEDAWHHTPMDLIANDRWRGAFQLDRQGRYVYAIIAWKDAYATFSDELTKKHNANIPIKLEIEEGLILVRETAEHCDQIHKSDLNAILSTLKASDHDNKCQILLSDDVVRTMRAAAPRNFKVRSHDVIVDAERIGARFANWYEIFPRSQSGDGLRHGTFRDVIAQLPRIAAMGFDVLYFPPIHPIGRINRKGQNNSLTPSHSDPGSPYAIGSDHGGHDALHPELGGFEDFAALIAEAAKLGIEIALDFAIQCAPDHPWLSQHKDWFEWRPDGSIRYAENPPKKYEDIVNVDFYAKGSMPSLWLALRDIVQFWIDHGIRLFRVDNPHTKPLPFWEWMIGDVRARHPDTIFLAEAFTRPKVMYRLAKIGFSQSYTYFTWRNTKSELVGYLTELNETAPKEYFRPHFFVNTPDINPLFLQTSGRAGFLIRAALAATLSGLWGVYNGFELCEAAAIAPGKEEYLDSEKYQFRAWDYDRPENIVAEITKLNSIRRRNAALQSHLGIQFHMATDDQVLFFSKTAEDGNVILAAICLDPFSLHRFDIELPLWMFGLPDNAGLDATDLMRDFEFTWHGKFQDVTLHPGSPFCIWRIRPEGA